MEEALEPTAGPRTSLIRKWVFNMKIVEVSWIDAWSEAAEITADHAQNLLPIKRRHIGYLLKQSNVAVILAGGVLDKIPEGVDSFCDISVIPMGIVMSIKVLREDA